jgi:hypothetical protein
MLSNNIAYLFVEDKNLEFFNKTESCIGMIIGSVSFLNLILLILKITLENRKKRNSKRNYPLKQ